MEMLVPRQQTNDELGFKNFERKWRMRFEIAAEILGS
ncbi:MAG: hypothetical protein Greene07144_163 [Parcubacteria group bacterium Greene0714_4]|nr:MAG: hypothetical protein Greene07144_163 [Parcubacteria group bacterium Greene0714_4]